MSFRRIATFVLIASAIAIGTGLRFEALGTPSFWLDEILGQQLTISAHAQPWWHWLTGLEAEHGPLYYATQLVGNEFTGRLMAASFGVIAIALLAFIRDRDASIAALLLAIAPLHVYYSREARPYALLILLTTIVIVALLREIKDVWIIVALIALLYTSAVAAPIVAATAIAAFCVGRKRVALVATLITAAFLLLYRGTPQSTPNIAFPHDLFATIGRALTVSALATNERGRTVIAMLVLALIGAIALWRRDRRAALIVIAMTLLPIAFAVTSLFVFKHWFAVRYVAPAIIGFVLLVAAGIGALAMFLGRREIVATLLAIIAVIAIASELLPNARSEAFRKLDWRAVAATLREQVRPGEIVLAAEPWSEVSLRHYLGNDVNVVGTTRVDWAEMLVDRKQARWLVSAGYSADTNVRGWMCRYPVVMSSALESLRVHFAGTQRELLDRAKPSTLRAVAAQLPRITFGRDDSLFLGEGWANAEDGFRWAAAKHATLQLPVSGRRDRVIHVHALPLPPQSMRVSLNNKPLGDFTLTNEWRDYAITAPASSWIDGMNTLAFDFAHASSPGPNDARTLAVSFSSIAIDDVKNVDRPAITAMRIDADRFIDAQSAWRNTRTRFAASQLHRARVEALLARLGFDPLRTWPRIASGDVHLDDVVMTIAYGSDCEDDRAFVVRAFAILLERKPNAIEERDLLARMKAGATREAIIERIVKSGDFRVLALSFARQ